MEKKVFKYPVVMQRFGPRPVAIDLPPANIAKVVAVGMQGNDVMIWVETVENFNGTGLRTFEIFGTGQAIPEQYFQRDPDGYGNPGHVGTAFDGLYVWHVYEGPSKRKGQS